MAQRDLLAGRTRSLVQLGGFVRRELAELLGQPRLLVLLVLGPFLVLVVFAAGYDQRSVVLRTVFVGPEDGFYESVIDTYEEELSEYIVNVGYTSDVVEGRERLGAGEADVVVVFPTDPVGSVLQSEQAMISVLHDKLDPIQQTAVEVSAQVAVLQLNATLLERLLATGQDEIPRLDEAVASLGSLISRLAELDAVADADERADLVSDIRTTLRSSSSVVAVTQATIDELAGSVDPSRREELATLDEALVELGERVDDVESATGDRALEQAIEEVEVAADEVVPLAQDVLEIDPRVAVRPFGVEAANLVRAPVSVTDFFAPSSLGLLLQHLAVTLAALAIVRDETLGLFESFRVGPVGARHVVAGKYLAYLVVGGLVAAALVVAVIGGVGVPMRGSPVWLALGVALVLCASVGLGLLLSVLSATTTQAVQYAMLTLFAGLFFGGFLVPLDSFRLPVRVLSQFVPATFAIRWFQDVMLRGTEPATRDVVGLVVASIGYGGLAVLLIRRRLAVR